ncbi:MAG: hypothetical protein ACRBF0_11230 [Calditrichia bacterium]
MLFDENDHSGAPQLALAVKLLWGSVALTLLNVVFNQQIVEGLFNNWLLVSFFVFFLFWNIVLIRNIAIGKKWALYTFIGFFVLGAPAYIKSLLLVYHEISINSALSTTIVVLQLVAILLMLGPPGSHQFEKANDMRSISD